MKRGLALKNDYPRVYRCYEPRLIAMGQSVTGGRESVKSEDDLHVLCRVSCRTGTKGIVLSAHLLKVVLGHEMDNAVKFDDRHNYKGSTGEWVGAMAV